MRSLIEAYRRSRLEEVRRRYKTPQGHAYFELITRVRNFCDDRGIGGGRRGDVINFARKFSKYFWDNLVPICRFGDEAKIKEGVDRLLNFLEYVFLQRSLLDGETIRELEKVLVAYAVEVYYALKVVPEKSILTRKA